MKLKIDETLKHLINRHIQAVDAYESAVQRGDALETARWTGYLEALNGMFFSVYRTDHINHLPEYERARKQRTIFK